MIADAVFDLAGRRAAALRKTAGAESAAETRRMAKYATNASSGSGSDGRVLGFIAGKPPMEVRFP